MSFYVYVIYDPKTNVPRYVGKTVSLKRPFKHVVNSHNVRLKNMITKRLREGFEVTPLVFECVDACDAGAFAMECSLIEMFGREDTHTGTLFNMTSGGEGTAGAKRSEETRERMSAAQKARKRNPRSPEQKAALRLKLSQERKGNRVHSQETREKMSMAAKGRVFSEEHKANLSGPKSPEHIAALTIVRNNRSSINTQQS